MKWIKWEENIHPNAVTTWNSREVSTQVGCLKTLTVWEVWLQSQMLNVNQVGGWMHEALQQKVKISQKFHWTQRAPPIFLKITILWVWDMSQTLSVTTAETEKSLATAIVCGAQTVMFSLLLSKSFMHEVYCKKATTT